MGLFSQILWIQDRFCEDKEDTKFKYYCSLLVDESFALHGVVYRLVTCSIFSWQNVDVIGIFISSKRDLQDNDQQRREVQRFLHCFLGCYTSDLISVTEPQIIDMYEQLVNSRICNLTSADTFQGVSCWYFQSQSSPFNIPRNTSWRQLGTDQILHVGNMNYCRNLVLHL